MDALQLGPAPTLVARADRPRGTVLLLHGQGADALTNAKELALLRGAGFHAVGVDAPEHGRRHDPERDARWEADKWGALDQHLHTASEELPAILDGCAHAGLHGPYGAVGISLGAFTLWRALPREPRLVAAVPLLGSPVPPGHPAPDPAPWAGRSVLAISAEHDEVVPRGPTDHVTAAIGATHHVLPGSPHAVPELHWFASWGRIVAWLGDRMPMDGA